MQLFYFKNADNNHFLIEGDDFQHCIKSLRHKTGDTIHATDGKGCFFTGEIITISRSNVIAKITSQIQDTQKRNYYLHMGVAPTKNNDRYEWFLEKAVELGIDEITPIICRHSERKFIQKDRLERVMISAMKQSLKATLPIINDACGFDIFLAKTNSDFKYIAYCGEGDKEMLSQIKIENKKVLVLIGPEGDFSPDEVQSALLNECKVLSLGSSRLRTETAAVTACAGLYLNNV